MSEETVWRGIGTPSSLGQKTLTQPGVPCSLSWRSPTSAFCICVGGGEKECAGCSTTEKRLRFLSLGWESRRGLLQEIGREDARKELLFGLKIQRGEIVPLMES